jgi:putative DNA primase/helicase
VQNDSTKTVPPTVPEELRERQQWVCWRYELRDGKPPTKVPYSPLGGPASVTDAATWASYEAAVAALREKSHDGVGFILSPDDPFTAIDLDACRNPKTGELEEWAQELVGAFDSYAEVSPSGRGIHVFVRGELPPGGNKRGPIEMYSKNRFFTFSGNHISGTPLTIEERDAKLAKVHRRVFGEPASATGPRHPGNSLSDTEILARASQAANGEAFEKLWAGDASGFTSKSEADLALCSYLAFWTGGEPGKVDELFRHSGLYRAKWDERHYGDGRTYGQATIEKALEGATAFHVPGNDEWEDPVPLPEGLPPVGSLDPAMLPEPLRGWIMDVSERMQIPPDFAATGAVVVTGSLIGRKVGIHPKRHDDWLVVPNLWGAVVGRPSLLKSPALAEVMKPLARLIAEAYEEHQEAMLTYETDMMVAEATKTALKDDLRKAAREPANSRDRSKLDEIARRGQVAEVPEEPVLKRYKTEDATVEKISEILLENPRGILVHRDELSGWLRNLDKQGREGDRSFYLEAWNGTGSFDVDRIGRGSLHVPALCVSTLGSIQPGPLSAYVYQATQGEKGDDGLLQRFQLLVWPDPSPSWRNVDRWPDTEVKNRAYEIFKRLEALNPKDFGESGEDEEGIPAVRFTDEAQEVFDRWRDELETRLRTEELPPALESHLAKYRSLMPSLALIFHLIEYVDGTAEGGAVGLRPALQAAAWCEYLETHAARLYSSAENPAMEGARVLFQRIRNGDLSDGDSTRSVYRRHWTKLSTPEEVNDACSVLEEFGWLRVEAVKTSGRSTTRLRLHPSLIEPS